KTDPDWNLLPPPTPLSIRSLLRHCLRKDARRRLQAIGDAAFAIEEAQNAPAQSVEAGVTARRRWIPIFLTAIIAASIGALAVVLALSRPIPLQQKETQFSFPPPDGVIIGEVTVSPDGRTVAFTSPQGQTGIWTRRLDSLESAKLAGTEGAAGIFWSPDGRS